MTAGIVATHAAAFLIRAAGTGSDPLGPVDQDPDSVRDIACELVGPASRCEVKPATAPPTGGSSIGIVTALLWLLLFAAIVVLVVLLVKAVVQRTSRPAKQAGERTGDTGDTVEALDPTPRAIDHRRQPAQWRAEADEHRRAGRFRDALRCRYRALVGDLARRGLIDEIPGRTTGEERAQMGEVAPRAEEPFSEAADLFDKAWYGHLTVDERDDDRLAALDRDVLQRTAGGRG